MDLSLANKKALVCGSTRGIGHACAEELALLGADVTLLARDVERLKQVAFELPTPAGPTQKHHWIAADFADLDSVRRAVAGEVDLDDPFHILINNTGGPPGGTAIDSNPEQFLAAFHAHLLANQVLVQLLVPGMKKAGYGRIVNIISTSVKAPIPGLGVSNTIRGAVASWAKTLAHELGGSGITVNNVLPGFTRTDRLGSLLQTRARAAGKGVAEIERELIATIPAGRFADPRETGAAVAFLCSPSAGYINGINLPVDGGRLPTL